MDALASTALTVQRLRLTEEVRAGLNDCVKIEPNLFLRLKHGHKYVEKMYLDLIFDQYLDERNNQTLFELFTQWEEETQRIVQQVQQKWSVDVALLGPNKVQKQHICKECGKSFSKPTALGGHTSKMHPSVKKEAPLPTLKLQGSQKKSNSKTNKTKAIKKSQPRATRENAAELGVIFQESWEA